MFCRILFQPDLPVYVAIKGVVFDVSEARSKIFLKSLPVGYNTHALNISRVLIRLGTECLVPCLKNSRTMSETCDFVFKI